MMPRRLVQNHSATSAGNGRPVEWARTVLESCDRKKGGVTAAPHGLYLVQVEYPEQFKLPERYLGPHFLSGLPDFLSEEKENICANTN